MNNLPNPWDQWLKVKIPYQPSVDGDQGGYRDEPRRPPDENHTPALDLASDLSGFGDDDVPDALVVSALPPKFVALGEGLV